MSIIRTEVLSVLIWVQTVCKGMPESRKFCQSGSNTDNVFYYFFSFFIILVEGMERGDGERIEMPLKVGHHWPASKTSLNGVLLAGQYWPIIECWLGSFVIFQGIRINIARKPYIFVIFHGGRVSWPCPPSGSGHAKVSASKRQTSPVARRELMLQGLFTGSRSFVQ